MLIPTPKFFIHSFLDDAKHQCHQKYKVQLCFWSAKQAIPQLTSSVLAKQEEPERMKAWCALTLGFLNLYQTDAMKKNLKTKQKCLSPECSSTSSSSLAAGPGSYTDWISSTHTQIHHPSTVSCLLSGAYHIHQAGWLVHSLSSGYFKKGLYCLRAIT